MTQSDIGIVEKLEPCPFCRGVEVTDMGGSFGCTSCGATGPYRSDGTDLSAWNARDPIITEMVEALEEIASGRPNDPQMIALDTLAKVRGK